MTCPLSRRLCVQVLVVTVFVFLAAVPDPAAADQEMMRLVDTIKIQDPSGQGHLLINTFCLDGQGNLLVSCGGKRFTYQRTEAGMQRREVSSPYQLRQLSPEGQLLKTVELPFAATAINVGPDGRVWLGGNGRVAVLDDQLRLLKAVDSPARQLADLEQMKQKVRRQAEQQYQRMVTMKQNLEKQMADDALSDEQKGRLKRQLNNLERTLPYYKQRVDKAGESFERSLQYRLAVTGIAATGKDVFVCCASLDGSGYDVYRTDEQLSHPVCIIKSLRGCCGQMDIQAHGDKLYVAENARKKVRCFDRQGKELGSWGADARSVRDGSGFGACCNPMNLCFGADGSCYTSEASVGSVKRFTPDGRFEALVCQAKDIPSCKHTPIGLSPDGRRLYLLDSPKSRLFVFAASSKAQADARR